MSQRPDAILNVDTESLTRVQTPSPEKIFSTQSQQASEVVQSPIPGMADAKSQIPVKMAEQMNQIALRMEKKLPYRARPETILSHDATSAHVGASRASGHAKADVDLPDAGLLGVMPAPVTLENLPPSRAGAEGAWIAKADAHPEALGHVILNHVAEMKQLNAATLAVVLRPDAQTELFLHLYQRNDGIEVHVQCDQGHYEAFNANWGQLQQTLALQGIRVAPLNEPVPKESGSGPGPAGNYHQSPNHTGQHQPQRQPEPREESTFVGSLTEPLRLRRTRAASHTNRGWETWA
jgi:hypothetical protein